MSNLLTFKDIKKMPLNKLSFDKKVGEWQDNWFRDIIERNAHSGDLYSMLREAYVLGFDHCLRGQEHLNEQKVKTNV